MADPVIDSGYPKVLVADNDPRLDGWTGLLPSSGTDMASFGLP